MKIIHLDKPICDKQRAELLFSSHLLIYTHSQSMIELLELTKVLLAKYFGKLDPVHAQQTLTKEQFLNAVSQAQLAFQQSNHMRQLFFNVLSECGVSLSQCYYDHFPLRVVPFKQQHAGIQRSAIGHHRDTWGSNIHCQQNWWAPIFNLTEERTIAFYPDYWEKPIANTTKTWCFEQYKKSRSLTKSGQNNIYPSAPVTTAKVDENNIVKVLLQPGEILNFSSAHLHASVPNSSNKTRYSIEMRTLNTADLRRKIQAPNVDNEGQKPMYSWFKNVITNNILT